MILFVAQYYDAINNLLKDIYDSQLEEIQKIGMILADTLENDGLIHVFGCGHSHMMEEELFYRAGGLAAVNPLFEGSVMLHEGAVKSSMIERMHDYAPLVLEQYTVEKKDSFIISSSSGINPFPIEMAIEAKKSGATVIGITSCFYDDEPTREKNGNRLRTVCDHYINNFVPRGDVSVQVLDNGIKAGPVSSMATLFIANSLMLSACEELRRRNIDPEIFVSGNLQGGFEHNESVIKKYRGRIKHL